jgi:inhibitor of growth protein 3
VPPARDFVNTTASAAVQEVDTDAGAGDGDGDGDDGKTYCFCDRVSFGEMIACDDENCEREWVSICCVIYVSYAYADGAISSTSPA